MTTWRATPKFTVEAGLRLEDSTISSTGDVVLTKTLFYPKPRILLSWNVDKNTQLRARAERVLGQLNFNDFVATSNLSAAGVNAGNPTLNPDQHDH